MKRSACCTRIVHENMSLSRRMYDEVQVSTNELAKYWACARTINMSTIKRPLLAQCHKSQVTQCYTICHTWSVKTDQYGGWSIVLQRRKIQASDSLSRMSLPCEQYGCLRWKLPYTCERNVYTDRQFCVNGVIVELTLRNVPSCILHELFSLPFVA